MSKPTLFLSQITTRLSQS